MRLFLNRQGYALVRMAQVGAAIGVAALIAGCGNNYRPVVTPVNNSGPASQPTSWLIAVSNPSPTSAGIATIIDYSGDSVLVQVPIGLAPTTFTLDSYGSTGYTINADGTITDFPLSTSLQFKQEITSTLPASSVPVNMTVTTSNLLMNNLTGNGEDVYSGSPAAYKLTVPVAPTPVFTVGSGNGGGAREFVLSQNFVDPTGVACNISPRNAPANGVATPIELSTNSADPTIPLGRCPVYGIISQDLKRVFVLNRGDDTITVINSQSNALDNDCPAPGGCVNQNGQKYFSHPTLPLSTSAVTTTGVTPPNGTAGMTATAGPIYAEYNAASSQIVVANYDASTISVIDVSLDPYGNDSSTFGTTYTIPVGNNPASVTVLNDGSRAYTANQTDSTVTIVNLVSHTVEKTLAVVGHPRTVVSTQNSLYGKVYTGSPDSPYITIIQTQQDLIDTTVLLVGHVVDIRTTTQNGNSGNANYSSRIPGYGQPCNLPPPPGGYPLGYTLAQCQVQP